MESIWKKTAKKPRFETLDTDKSTDVLIIGGGIAGILCAYRLKKAGIDCMLVEAAEICGGTTGNTTAKLTLSHGAIYDKMIRRFGVNKARLYAEAQINACLEYAGLCENIDCDYEIKDNYVYSLTDREKIEREVLSLKRIGINAESSIAAALPFTVAGAVRVRDQAQLHPLKFLYSLAEGLPIYEHTKVVELCRDKAITNRSNITYNKLIVATHFPILNKHGLYPLKLYQHRSYVIALENAEAIEGMYVDSSDGGLSFRSCGDLLLIGGGGHRTGKRSGGWQEMEIFARQHYGKARVVARWAAQDCMTLDGIPYIGQYSRATPNMYVATGFNKWGMTNSMVASGILLNLLAGKSDSLAEIFDPSRTVLRPQLALNALETAIGLLTPTLPRCPHLGCALKYNRAEHSWDCPCHGSRFTEQGELIDNPATDDKGL